MSYHKLLSKQILKFLPETLQQDPALQKFLSAVSESYTTHDRERDLSERAFKISEEEYSELNERLQKEAEVKRLSIEKLKEAVSTISGIGLVNDSDDLLMIAKILNLQISKRKNAEKIFTSLTSNMQSGVLLEDETRQIVFCNQLFCDIFQITVSPESLQGLDCNTYMEKYKHFFKSPEHFIRRIEKIIANQKLVSREVIEMTDGRIFERDYIPILIENKYKGQLWSYTDITEIRNSQKTIEQAEEKNRFIMNASQDAIITTDSNGVITFWNPQAEKIFGWNEKDVSGKKLSESIIPLQYREKHDSEMIRFAKKNDGLFLNKQIEIIAVTKSGTEFPAEFSVIPIKQGDTEFFCSFIKDISDRKKYETELERLSLIIQQSRNAIIIADAEGNVEWVNDAYTKITGYTFEEVKGKGPGLAKGELTDMNTVNFMLEKVSNAEPFTCDIYNYKKSGEGYWVRVNAQPIFDKNKKVTQYFSFEEDVTKEKESQEKLKAAAARMSSLISNLHAGILLSNEDRTISLANQHFCDLFDLKEAPSSFTGSDCSVYSEQISHLFKSSGDFINRINKILDEREPVIAERLELNDGRCFERDFVPIWNDNIYNGHLWVYTDITDQISNEKKLDEQRVFYEEILDNIPSDIAVFDSSHRYLYVNPVGIKDDELRKWIIGKKDEDFFKYRNKPLTLAEERAKLFNRILEIKQLTRWEEEMSNPDGTSQTILRNLFPVLNKEGEVKIVIGYGVDITNIKKIQKEIEQSEKRYRDVVDHSLAIITTHDMDGRFLTVNPMASKIFGYADEEIIGHLMTDFMPENERPFFDESYLLEITNKKEASGIFKIIHKTGKNLYILYKNFLKEDPGINPYVIGFSVDITDRILAERELRNAKQLTEEMAQTKQNFLANMSHEIRTPMNAILGMTNQLAKTTLTNEQQFNLRIIHSSAENLLVIINDILDLSKIEAGKLKLEKIGFELKEVIDRVTQVMVHKAEEKGILMTNDLFDSQISKVFLGDPYRLNQILLNLISNAIKFTEKGSVDISCEVINETELKQTVKITVKDTGVGMDKFFTKNLFKKFTQEDESVGRRFGGTGLGMSICKELIELMKGEITVQSHKGVGTEFSFSISFEKGTDEQLPVKETKNINAEIIENKKILIVDDNEINRLVATTVLKNYKADIDEAANGFEAVQKIELSSYDIVLMDVHMPVMDGFEATKYIRNTLRNDLPVIALTAFALKDDNLKCLEAGMNDYLSKPFNEIQLISIILKWLGENQVAALTELQEFETAALYDLTMLKELVNGDQAFIQKMIKLFCEQIPVSIEEIKEAYQIEDFIKVKEIAHRIKPSIDNMGIHSLKKEIRQIEKLALENTKSGELTELIDRLEFILNEVIEAIKNE